jgi:hypothetical protein
MHPAPGLRRALPLALALAMSACGPADEPQPESERPAGMWHKARLKEGETADMERLRELANVPYLDGYEAAPDERSVVLHVAERAWPGVNLVLSGHAPEASLIDMAGDTLHEWRYDASELWSEGGYAIDPGFLGFWRRAHVFPNGDLLVIFDGIGMIKLDRESNLLWDNPGHYHHDLFVASDGTIYTLSRHERAEHDRIELKGPLQEDFVSVLDADGRETRRVSVLSCFLDSDYSSVLAGARKQGDMLHVNTLELMDGRFAERHPLYAAGNALISVPTLNTIAVLDLERGQVVWALGGLWKFQHQPTVLDDGRMLVFDNLGYRDASKVVEIDPLTQEIVWAWRGSDQRPFRSHFLGSSQRLDNGNTLITESTAGRAFEVTRDHELVWDFVNPNRAGAEGELIASLLEVVRIDRGAFTDEFIAAWAR